MVGSPDYEKRVTIQGEHSGALKVVAVDGDGQIYALMVGANGQVVAVDATGHIVSVMQGQFGTALKTLLCDSEGRLLAQLMGMYGTTAVPVAVDAAGSLKLTSLAQSNIEPDANEAQTWDVSLGTLLNNLNRIRWMLVTITGEAWGTVSHSLTAIWAKFHATTGHAHTGTGTDAPTIDHGTTTGRTDDDHERYWDKDGSKPVTGTSFKRDVSTSEFVLHGGNGSAGSGAVLEMTGSEYGTWGGRMYFSVPNAAKSAWITAMIWMGNLDSPYLDMQSHEIKTLLDPTAAQSAATKNYVDTSAIAKTGFIILWSGSIATIPTGWLLCNGGGTTPNLKNQFVVGAGDTYAVGETGGEATHALTIAELAAHTHTIDYGNVASATGTAVNHPIGANTRASGSTGSGTAHENRPPYYALAYIMKT